MLAQRAGSRSVERAGIGFASIARMLFRVGWFRIAAAGALCSATFAAATALAQPPCGAGGVCADVAPDASDREGVLGERIEVRYVELWAGVYRRGRPLAGMEQGQFRLFEDGVEQELVRFEAPSEQPFHVVLVVDASESMEHRLDSARDAAMRFARRGMREQDRVAIVIFRHRPELAVGFTNYLEKLRAGFRGLQPMGSTSLYDALAFGLGLFNGIDGKKALLVFTDGRDEGSRLDFEAAMRIARSADVLVYPVGLTSATGRDARRRLEELAAETGGRAFFIGGLAALVPIYGSIAKDLGLRYLLAYQSSNAVPAGPFREIEIRTLDPELEVRSMKGYFP